MDRFKKKKVPSEGIEIVVIGRNSRFFKALMYIHLSYTSVYIFFILSTERPLKQTNPSGNEHIDHLHIYI